MHRYLASNFPQTAAMPSKEQKESQLPMNNTEDILKSMKKPLSGTSFDNPTRRLRKWTTTAAPVVWRFN